MALTRINTKIRGLVADISKSDFQAYTYTTSAVFRIAVPNATATSILVNGAAITASDWSYNSTTQDVTITSSLTAGDAVVINFTYYKFSDTELEGYIVAALVYYSIYSFSSDEDYEVENSTIYPTPSNVQEDMIALIASILIKPNWSLYRTPTLEVRYPANIDKDEKIYMLVTRSIWAIGDITIIEFNQ